MRESRFAAIASTQFPPITALDWSPLHNMKHLKKKEREKKMKADYEQKLVLAGQKLVQMEEERVQATADKKVLEGENVVIKKDMEDLAMALQKLEQDPLFTEVLFSRATSNTRYYIDLRLSPVNFEAYMVRYFPEN